ncbi:MAG: hypothetical protein KF833_06515 [Verrucomicrobiae bacterium]|nr:hypothetical protein [Verrucomicrobiae bacterium]
MIQGFVPLTSRTFRLPSVWMAMAIMMAPVAALQAQGLLVNGAAQEGTLPQDGDKAYWSFSAEAGDHVRLRVSAQVLYPRLNVMGPDGSSIGTAFDSSNRDVSIAFSVATSGMHVVEVDSYYAGGTGAYRLQLARAPGEFVVPEGDQGGPLTNGGNHQGQIPLGDIDAWTFEGAEGDRVRLRMGTTGIYPQFTVVRPDGTVAGTGFDQNARDAALDVVVTVAGRHTVLVESYYMGSEGGYTLRYVKVPGDVEVADGDEGGPLVNGIWHDGLLGTGDLDPWTFLAEPGDRVSLRLQTEGVYPHLTVIGPLGAVVGSAWNANLRNTTLGFSVTNAGQHTVVVEDYYRDGTGSYRLEYLRWPPDLHVPGTVTLDEGTRLEVEVSAVDPVLPGKTLTFALVAGPAGSVLTPLGATNAVIIWQTSEPDGPGTHEFVVTVTDMVDGQAYTRTNAFMVVVREVNAPPVLDPVGDIETRDESVVRIVVRATDPDVPANEIRYSLGPGAPEGMTLDPATGELIWPIGVRLGSEDHEITVVATDDGTPPLSDEVRFRIRIEPPRIRLGAIADREVDEHALLSVTASVTNSPAAVPPYQYSLQGVVPEGAGLSAATGVFFWRPGEAQGPSEQTITIRVTDSATPPQSAEMSFRVRVREVNEAPELAPLADQSTGVAQTLRVPLEATDADLPANGLTFTLEDGAPEGMMVVFNRAIEWTPDARFAGTTNRVTVRVTDDGVPPLSHTQSFTVVVMATADLRLVVTSGDPVRWSLMGDVGRFYLIEGSGDLRTWTAVTNFLSEATETPFTDPAAATAPRRFYRAIAP